MSKFKQQVRSAYAENRKRDRRDLNEVDRLTQVVARRRERLELAERKLAAAEKRAA